MAAVWFLSTDGTGSTVAKREILANPTAEAIQSTQILQDFSTFEL